MQHVTQTNVAGTGAVNIVPASGDADQPVHLKALIITTPNTAVSVLTLSDGTKTVAKLDYPNSATLAQPPLVIDMPIPQSANNAAWTLTASINASGYNVTAVWTNDPI